ncbi:hypothetical protein SEPCBS119000_001611 [Sporothrix epigloea]|uniref:LIM zinc-binding domain-containing protein n=1 Tax=Sporothrix epigloea TaxID=1892477 RepID=A0ABP0DEQ8_9PEZI
MSTVAARGKPKDRTPSGNYMSNDQFANYLADLRTNRIARPGGARPLPCSSGSASYRESGRVSTDSRTSFGAFSVSGMADALPDANQAQQHSHINAPSVFGRTSLGDQSIAGSFSSRYSTISGRGRDYYPPTSIPARATVEAAVRPLRPNEVVPTDTYMESGQRWMEKEEVVSLRSALKDMDLKQQNKALIPAPNSDDDSDEQRIYKAALDEAADLVWQHQNGVKPPEPGAPYQYKHHLRKDSYAHARTASVGRYGNDIEPTGLARDSASRSVSNSSAGSSVDGTTQRRSCDRSESRRVASNGSAEEANSSDSAHGSHGVTRDNISNAPTASLSLRSKTYKGLAGGPRPMDPPSSVTASSNTAAAGRRRSSMKRNISGKIESPFTGDQIYEEPEPSTPGKRVKIATSTACAPNNSALRAKPESTVNTSFDSVLAGATSDSQQVKFVSRSEIHRNSPSQSHKPQYTVNGTLNGVSDGQPAFPKKSDTAASPNVPRKNGVEIRSDDIRSATSMKLKDRNPKLPTPSYVSDTPGRPIVSFDVNWKPPAPADESATDTKPDGLQKANFSSSSSSGNGGSSTAVQVGGRPLNKTRRISPKNIFARRAQQKQQQAAAAAAATAQTATLTHSTSFRVAQPVTPQQLQEPRVPRQYQQASFSSSQQQHQTQGQPQPQAHSTFSRPFAVEVAGTVTPSPAATVSTPSAIPTICVSEDPTTPAAASSICPQITIPTISVTEDPAPSEPTSFQHASVSSVIPTIVLPEDNESDAAPPAAKNSASRSDVPAVLIPGHGRSDRDIGTPSVPLIVTPDDHTSPAPALSTTASSAHPRPLPTPVGRSGGGGARRGHWSRAHAQHPAPPMSSTGSIASRRATARCHECQYPIEGRFIALAGLPDAASGSSNGSERFHPQCFRCYSCGTSLEALEISPEPDSFRAARLDRIARRARGETLEEIPGETMGEDGDERLRFFCHLDWHEQFAPRCKHCTTPIVGEHVVALGEHWHVGHFFCAECGDPFGPGATHIEKDGYAWCVSCQTRRTERRAPKCRACGKAVIGQYVQALAAEWHEDCFRCAVCDSGFDDGQIFPRQGKCGLMQVVCTMCRQRELKA